MDDIGHLTELFERAKKVDTSQNSVSARIAAAVVIRNRVIARGTNERKSHPFQAQFSKKAEAIFWHAETRAIHSALKRIAPEELSQAVLYICRARYTDDTGTDWRWGMSRPCSGCLRAVNTFRISRVVYSMNRIGEFGVIVPD